MTKWKRNEKKTFATFKQFMRLKPLVYFKNKFYEVNNFTTL